MINPLNSHSEIPSIKKDPTPKTLTKKNLLIKALGNKNVSTVSTNSKFGKIKATLIKKAGFQQVAEEGNRAIYVNKKQYHVAMSILHPEPALPTTLEAKSLSHEPPEVISSAQEFEPEIISSKSTPEKAEKIQKPRTRTKPRTKHSKLLPPEKISAEWESETIAPAKKRSKAKLPDEEVISHAYERETIAEPETIGMDWEPEPDPTPSIARAALSQLSITAQLPVKSHLVTFQNKNKTTEVSWGGNMRPSKGDPEFLGQGGWGVAQRVTAVVGRVEKTKVLKTSLEEVGNQGKDDLRNEVAKLEQIHAEGTVPGIQKKLRLITLDRTDPITGEPEIGHLGRYYKGDVQSLWTSEIQTSDKQMFSEFNRMASGLAYMHKLGIVHGDIKAKNVMYDTDDQGLLKLYLADLGGARNQTEIVDSGDLLSTATLDHMAYSDALKLADLELQLKQSITPQEKEAAITLIMQAQQKRDVFAMGALLWTMIHRDSESPFVEGPSGFCSSEFTDKAQERMSQLEKQYGPEVPELLKGLLEPDDTKRLSLDQVQTSLQKIIPLFR